MARGLETKGALLKRDGEEWLGGEAHVGPTDPRSSVSRILRNLRASRAFHIGFGFASGLIIGIGLAILLTRRQQV
jgi:hypothetical protein